MASTSASILYGVNGAVGATGPAGMTGPNASDMLVVAPSADVTGTGLRETVTVGESVVFGDLLYCKSDGKWWKADANAIATMPGMRLALASASANATCNTLLIGMARNDAWSWTVGGTLYASASVVGGLSQTAPSGTTDVIQAVGVAYATTYMLFHPSLVTAEVK